MKQINNNEITAGQILIPIETTSPMPGLVRRLCKVLGIDYPFAILLIIDAIAETQHTVKLSEFTFAKPTKDFIKAALPRDFHGDKVKRNVPTDFFYQ